MTMLFSLTLKAQGVFQPALVFWTRACVGVATDTLEKIKCEAEVYFASSKTPQSSSILNVLATA